MGPKPGRDRIYTINSVSGCWIWERATDKDGYGYFKSNGRVVQAHRHYYEQAKGPIVDGLDLDHLCRNRRCVNPDHLQPVTHLENCRRGGVVKYMTIERAREVRARAKAGQTHKRIASEMGIGVSLVGQITSNRCWKEVACRNGGVR